MLSYEILLVKGGFPSWDDGHSTGVNWEDKRDWFNNHVLCRHQDEPKVPVLAPSTGTLNRCHIFGKETMSVLDGRVVWFKRMIGEGWVQEAVVNGVDRLGVRQLEFFSQVADC